MLAAFNAYCDELKRFPADESSAVRNPAYGALLHQGLALVESFGKSRADVFARVTECHGIPESFVLRWANPTASVSAEFQRHPLLVIKDVVAECLAEVRQAIDRAENAIEPGKDWHLVDARFREMLATGYALTSRYGFDASRGHAPDGLETRDKIRILLTMIDDLRQALGTPIMNVAADKNPAPCATLN